MKILESITIILLSFILTLSCNRIKDETKKIKEEIETEIEEGVDKVFPKFDAYDSDTDANKKRFKEFLQVDLSPDVQEIYCYSDQIGIDSKFQFGFSCDSSTVQAIIEKHQLKPDSTFNGSLAEEFDWWPKTQVQELPHYMWQNDKQNWIKEFWYNDSTAKAYYLEYDL